MTDPVRLAVLRLADMAPAVVADTEGYFRDEGLDVALSIEPSWANVADKLAWGALDAAVMLLPLALAAGLGLRGPATRLHVPMGISRGGNTIVVTPGAAADARAVSPDAATVGRAFAAWLARQAAPPRFAVVHVFSMHNLLLRHWLAEAGVEPDRALEIIVVPPERVVDELDAGRIAGFCAGAPWGDRAVELGVGRVLLGTSAIRPGHAEKCLAVTAAWHATHANAAAALGRALRRAQAQCAAEAGAEALARLLADRLDLPRAATRAVLAGGAATERVVFSPELPETETAWALGAMQRWGWVGPDVAPALVGT